MNEEKKEFCAVCGVEISAHNPGVTLETGREINDCVTICNSCNHLADAVHEKIKSQLCQLGMKSCRKCGIKAHYSNFAWEKVEGQVIYTCSGCFTLRD